MDAPLGPHSRVHTQGPFSVLHRQGKFSVLHQVGGPSTPVGPIIGMPAGYSLILFVYPFVCDTAITWMSAQMWSVMCTVR